MALKIFLKIEGIDGGSTVKPYQKWIEISSFSWGATQTTTAGGGTGTGKLTVKTVAVNMASGIATPGLIKLLDSGKATSAQIVVTSSQRGQVVQSRAHTIKLSSVQVESYAMGVGAADATPTDAVALTFLKLDIHTAIGGQTADASLTNPLNRA